MNNINYIRIIEMKNKANFNRRIFYVSILLEILIFFAIEATNFSKLENFNFINSEDIIIRVKKI